MIITIAMTVSDRTALKKSYLLHVCFTKSASLLLIWRSQGSLIVSIPLVLNSIFLSLKTITIQYRDIQGALTAFQKYRFCEDYANLFWTQMFLLEFLETNLGEFQTFPLPKLASFCKWLKQSCLYLAVLQMLTCYIDMWSLELFHA